MLTLAFFRVCSCYISNYANCWLSACKKLFDTVGHSLLDIKIYHSVLIGVEFNSHLIEMHTSS